MSRSFALFVSLPEMPPIRWIAWGEDYKLLWELLCNFHELLCEIAQSVGWSFSEAAEETDVGVVGSVNSHSMEES
jgi:hypothetical protein